MYLQIPYKINYDTNRFKFKELMRDILEIDVDLDKLYFKKQHDKLVRENYQSII